MAHVVMAYIVMALCSRPRDHEQVPPEHVLLEASVQEAEARFEVLVEPAAWHTSYCLLVMAY